MNYTHLTIEERCCLREYYLQGKSYREIAKLLGRNVSTVSREIRRNYHRMYVKFTYYPSTAQNKYERRRRFCHRGMFGNDYFSISVALSLKIHGENTSSAVFPLPCSSKRSKSSWHCLGVIRFKCILLKCGAIWFLYWFVPMRYVSLQTLRL